MAAEFRTSGRIAAFVAGLVVCAAAAVHAQSDTTAPVVQTLTFAPTTIDTRTSDQTVTVTTRVTDALSGVQHACFNFSSPSNQQYQGTCVYDDPDYRLSGDELDGTYSNGITFPQFAEGGTWHLYSVYVVDDVGNQRGYDEAALVAAGFNTTLEVTSAQDTAAPVLQHFSFAPGKLDTSNGDQTVTVTVAVTDNLSGMQYGCVSFRSPSGQQNRNTCVYDPFNLVSGDEINGSWAADVNFPQFSEAGTWHVDSLYVVDDVGNQQFYDEDDLQGREITTLLEVASFPSDTTFASLLGFSLAPTAINTSFADQDVTVALRITDAVSGADVACVYFSSPSSQQFRSACAASPVTGDEHDGIHEAVVTFPRFSESGTWHVDEVSIADRAGNERLLSESDLIAAGFPTTLSVVSPTPGAPTILSITPGNGQLTVAFTPGADGSAPITNYKYSVDGGTTFLTREPAATTSPIVITGLTNGVTYQVQLRAVNANGDGTPSLSTPGTPSTTPGPPTITGITPGNSQLTVAFTPGADGGSAIANYQYSIDGGEIWVTRTPPATMSPLVITGLANGATYQVRLRAVNAAGTGASSPAVAGTPAGTLAAPTITGITPGNLQLTVTFAPGADGGTPITNYEYSLDNGATWIARVPPAVTSPLTISGLINGMAYQVRLRAVNAIGAGAASASTVATPSTTPAAPLVTGIKSGNAQLAVMFTAGDDGGQPITNYRYSIDGGATWTSRSPAATTSPLVIVSLSNGAVYQVQLRAVNVNGEGAPTASVPATPALTSDETVDAFDPGANGEVLAIAVQPDGKILVGGSFTTLGGGAVGATPRNKLGRLNPDGSVDAAFDPGVSIAVDSRITNVAVQPDGKILVTSAAESPLGRRHIGRLNADGTRDTSFDFAAADNRVLAMAVQNDGKVLVGGAFTALGRLSEERARHRIGRFNADGTVDATFDPGANGDVAALAVLPDGRILVGGSFTTIGGGGTGSVPRQHLARLNTDGSVDMSFDPGIGGASDAIVRALRVQTDGRILVGGRFATLGGASNPATRHNIGRLHPDGTVDASFVPGPPSGVVSAGLPIVETILQLSNGKTLAGGIAVGIEHDDLLPRHLVRLNANGSLDADFEPRANGRVNALTPQADGTILVGGAFTMMGEHVRNRLARIGAPIPSTPTVPSPAFTDDPIVAGVTVLRAVHIMELRARIDALRLRFGLVAMAWTDTTLASAPVRAVHLQELREALLGATDAAFLQGRSVTRPVFADSPLTPAGSPIRAVHIQQLRAAVVALEQS